MLPVQSHVYECYSSLGQNLVPHVIGELLNVNH